jgi:hypothetical protein
MRRHLLLLLIGIFSLSISNQLKAQKPAYQIGKHIPPVEARHKRNYYSELIASTDEEFLIADRTKKGQVYTAYNTETLKKGGTFTLDYPQVNGKDANWVKRIFRAEETTSLYGYYNRKDDENIVYGKITDRNGKEIVKEKVLAKISASKKKYIGRIGRVLSKDQSKILIYREVTAKESEQMEIDLWLYDDQLNKIYKKKMKFPYKNKQFSVQQYLLTDDGKVIIIAYYTPSKDQIKANPDSKNSLNFKVFGLTEDKEELDEIKISKKGSALSSAYGWVLDSGNIVFTGYFREGGEKKYRYGANGIYYVKVNTQTWEVETSHFNKISVDDLTRIFEANASNDRQKKRAKKAADNGAGLSSFTLCGIYYNNDGSLKIISQMEWVTQVCNTDPKTGITTCHYIYNNFQIVEFDLDSEGNIARTIVIPKKQIMGTPIYNGHIALMSGSRTYFIFNDADKNFDVKKLAKHNGDKFYYTFGGGKKTRLVYAYAKKKGAPAKIALIDNYKSNMLILPGEFVRVDQSTVITWGKLRKGKELLLVKFYLKSKKDQD